MKIQRSIWTFLILVMVATTSEAYVGLRLGGFTNGGDTNFGGGVIFGLPLPVTGLAVEAEAMGYYDDLAVGNLFYLQTNVGPTYDFNSLITPDSNLIHPYIRAGFAYGWLLYSSDTPLNNDNGAGFYTGAGIQFVLPVILLGIEANYNNLAFDNVFSDDEFWTVFLTAGIHF